MAHFLYSIKSNILQAVRGTIFLWSNGFHSAWDHLSLTDKCIWLLFFSNTIALISLLEYLLLGHP